MRRLPFGAIIEAPMHSAVRASLAKSSHSSAVLQALPRPCLLTKSYSLAAEVDNVSFGFQALAQSLTMIC